MVLKAVSSWSLHRTLGRFISGDAPASSGGFGVATPASTGAALLDLPTALRAHGFDGVQLCHFHLPSRSDTYLDELRAALAESAIELEAVLIDDGDLRRFTIIRFGEQAPAQQRQAEGMKVIRAGDAIIYLWRGFVGIGWTAFNLKVDVERSVGQPGGIQWIS